ncbi:MAG: hypothetical protein IH914_09625, partial [candidate division Zixibacteria bacterium]|nr:hypothetical protein [candidate division Zixibacteria bacterium]
FASDPDGTTPTLSADSLPGNASFLDNGDGTGTITFAPNFVQAGIYTVFINVTDGSLTTTAPLVITVIEAGNQPPQMPFEFFQLDHVETDLISFTLKATDPDSTLPIMTATNLPLGATYVDIGNGEGSFVWQTENLQAGNYNVSFFAIDALDPLLFDSAIVNIDLADSNFVPLISVVPGQLKTVNEAQTLTFVVTASDFDGTIPILSTDTLYPNMTFVDDGNGTGTLTFTPDFTQGSPSPGTPYAVDFIATDAVDPSKIKSTTPQNFFVRNVNQPPVVAPIISPQTVVEGTTLSFTVQSSDADLEAPSTTFPVLRAENLPPNATAVHPASGDLTQLEFSFTPDFTQAGIFVISFIASDTQDEDSLLVQINVSDAGNQNPIWITILQDTTLVVAGTFSEIPLNSFEPDNDPVVLSLSFSPSGSALIDLGDGTGSFRYNPDAFDVGATIPVEFYVTDPAGAADTVRTVFVVRAFLRGDANTDTRIDLTDAVFLIDFLFRSGSAPVSAEAADVNFDLNISIADITFLINYLFRQGPPPPG